MKKDDRVFKDLSIGEIVRFKKMIGKKVRHFKGKEYLVLGISEHTETGETLVIYKALYDEYRNYARPIKMFLSKMDRIKYPIDKFPNYSQEYRLELVEE